MQEHHDAWLLNHPERDAAWLSERLRDGFDVHHLDGNHQNNDPPNLVLVEHLDHLRCIHGVGGNRLLAISAARGPRKKKPPSKQQLRRRRERDFIRALERAGLKW